MNQDPPLQMKSFRRILFLFSVIAVLSQRSEAAEPVEFGKHVYPILRDHCLKCHAAPYQDARTGRTKKPKGGIRFDSVELIKKGYINDEDKLVKGVVAGKPAKSSLYAVTTLPADHDDIMPATGDPLTKEQQNVLKQWIAQGADYSDFKAPVYINPKAKK
jgi:hypothetical protein